MSIYVLNDDYNTFDYVIHVLTKSIPMCNTLRAEQIARLVHDSGRCEVYSGFPPNIYVIYGHLSKSGLSVELKIN